MKPLAIFNCTLKKRYTSKEAATEAANWIWVKWEDNVDVYRCNICEGFHLTSRKEK